MKPKQFHDFKTVKDKVKHLLLTNPALRDNDMKLTIMSSLQTVLMYSKEDTNFGFNSDLAKEFSIKDTDKCANSTKLDFALNQFVNAFFEYERLEKKYPELMKIM